MTTFKDLGLKTQLLATLERAGYTTPTPVQAQAIPLLLQGHDILGIAQTGTGKTAAFALPILQKLTDNQRPLSAKTVRALILSPTRELATQIAESFETYGAGFGLSVVTIFGGVKYANQYKALSRGCDIVVATPGRLIDHLEQRTIDLREVEVLVLDEADQMLDLGFIKPIRQLVSRLPKERQSLFFSATMPKEVAGLVNELLTNPKRVEVTPVASTTQRVEQKILFVEQNRKRALLSELFSDDAFSRVLVFSRTKHGADRVTAYLQAAGISSAAIHGEKNQSQRERALMAFKDGRLRALVATDIASRGIDVDRVSHVINFDLPVTPEAYVHRIGRTARAGASGEAISLCADDERTKLKAIERTIKLTLEKFDRRKDKGLALFDQALIDSGIKDTPDTPERLPKEGDRAPRGRGGRDGARGGERGGERGGGGFGRDRSNDRGDSYKSAKRPFRKAPNEGQGDGQEPRHFDADAEFVHKRQRPSKPYGESRVEGTREDRPSFAERAPRAERSERPDRPRREEGDRPTFNRDRSDRPDHAARPRREEGDRPTFNRDRSDRPDHAARPRREEGDRPTFNRDRADRPDHAARPRREDGERPSFNRERSDRPFNRDRSDRPDQASRPRREDGERPSFNRDRSERGPVYDPLKAERTAADGFDKATKPKRFDPAAKSGRPFGDRKRAFAKPQGAHPAASSQSSSAGDATLKKRPRKA